MGNGYQQACPQENVLVTGRLDYVDYQERLLPTRSMASTAFDLETRTIFLLKEEYTNYGRKTLLLYKSFSNNEEGSVEVNVPVSSVTGTNEHIRIPFSPNELHVVKSPSGNPFIVMSSAYSQSWSAIYPGNSGIGLMVKSYKYEPGVGIQEAGRFGGNIFYGGGPIDSEFSRLLGLNATGMSIYSTNAIPLNDGYYLVYALLYYYDKQNSPFFGMGEEIDTSVSVYMLFRIEDDGTIRYVSGHFASAAPINSEDPGWGYYISAINARGFDLGYDGTYNGILIKLASDKNLFLEEALRAGGRIPSLRIVSVEINELEEVTFNLSNTVALIDPETVLNIPPDRYTGVDYYPPNNWHLAQVGGLVGRGKIVLNLPYPIVTRTYPKPEEARGHGPVLGMAEQGWVLLSYDEERLTISVDRMYIHSWFSAINSPASFPDWIDVSLCELEFSEDFADQISEVTGVNRDVIERHIYPCRYDLDVGDGESDWHFSVFGSSDFGQYPLSVPSITTTDGCYILPFIGFIYLSSLEYDLPLECFCYIKKPPSGGQPLKIEVRHVVSSRRYTSGTSVIGPLWIPFSLGNRSVALAKEITTNQSQGPSEPM